MIWFVSQISFLLFEIRCFVWQRRITNTRSWCSSRNAFCSGDLADGTFSLHIQNASFVVGLLSMITKDFCEFDDKIIIAISGSTLQGSQVFRFNSAPSSISFQAPACGKVVVGYWWINSLRRPSTKSQSC